MLTNIRPSSFGEERELTYKFLTPIVVAFGAMVVYLVVTLLVSFWAFLVVGAIGVGMFYFGEFIAKLPKAPENTLQAKGN